MRILFLSLAVLATAAGSARAGDEYRARRRAIEREFAPRYMGIAKDAKRCRSADLVKRAFSRAEAIAPGSDEVIAFDPFVEGEPSAHHRRRVESLEEDLRGIRREEARARLELAVWCDDEALLDESVAEAVAALTLAPGPVSFDERGVLADPLLGRLPETLSSSVLDEHEVYDGKLIDLEDVPDSIPWGRGYQLATAHFDIETNVSGRLCRSVGRALESARPVYEEVSGFRVDRRITVWIVANREQYEKLWRNLGKEIPSKTNIGKCYRDFCGVNGEKGIRETVSVAIHEVAHGYLNLGIEALTGTRGATMPVWFHEGFATYCAGYGPGSLTFCRGMVDPETARDRPLAHFREMVEQGEAMSLEKFLVDEEGTAPFYYQAYAFFWFWREVEDEDLRARFARAYRKMCEAALGEDRAERGNEIFLREIGLTVPEISKRFLAWAKEQ